MQVNYTFSHPLIAVNQPASVDVIVSFKGENAQTVPRLPLNLSLVLDRSGSMGGQPLSYAIQAAQKLVEYLTPEDYLSVVIYDDTPQTILSPQLVQDEEAIQSQIGRIRAGGLTNLSGGWLMGCDRVKQNQSSERINRVLLLTDGQANQGITNPQVLINTAREQAEQGIITTTLGFGNYFNEDLLIGMANAAGGNYYYIQTPDEAEAVFRIELESLLCVAAQNLTVTLQPEASVAVEQLNNYRTRTDGNQQEVFLGDVYGSEPKPLAIALSLAAYSTLGNQKLATLTYQYQTVTDGTIQQLHDKIELEIVVGSPEQASGVQPNAAIQEETTKLRIAKVKDEAISLADRGNYRQASEKLRQTVTDLKLKALDESFAVAEEIEQLDYYAQRLETRQFDSTSRKEMRDQSYQAQARDRSDLKLRGISGSTDRLEAVSSVEGGLLVKCIREGGKLRVRAVSEGYNSELNIQFPRGIREAEATYVVEDLQLSANDSFYRASGEIKLFVPPGQERQQRQMRTAAPQKRQTAKATGSAADLDTTTTVGDGVLVQCVKDGKKLRARVVSDGYNPDYNIRFPRNVREEGMLFVVDEVKENAQGGSYIAYGKIRRLVQ